MVNQVYVSDEKMKDILAYITTMRHHQQIKMMFLCSICCGMRSINFTYLQIKDVYTSNFEVKDVIILDKEKNKGKYGANYYLNKQMKKEFMNYLMYLKTREGDNLTPATYLFVSQKLGKPYNRVSISRLFSRIYHKFEIQGASHLGRHFFISKMIDSGINPFIVKTLVNHKNISTTNHYYNHNPQQLINAIECLKL